MFRSILITIEKFRAHGQLMHGAETWSAFILAPYDVREAYSWPVGA
jgi:hypothetical protein